LERRALPGEKSKVIFEPGNARRSVKMRQQIQFARAFCWLAATTVFWLATLPAHAAGLFLAHSTNALVRVVVVENQAAISDFQPDATRVREMVERGIENLTRKATIVEAWRSLVSTQDIVGIKVFSAAGQISGTRPAVVAAVVHGLLDAGLPPANIIIWDKHADDLRAAGFFQLAAQLGVRAAGAADTGYDPTNFYLPDSAIIGSLVYGDFEFGKKGEGVGRKSFVSKLVSRQMTKIISVAPLLNENEIGVSGQLYSLALGGVDNTFRFEGDADRLAIAVPEIYALPALGDRVALDITDALLGQYEGSSRGLLQYSFVLDQLWFSRDPVALDTLAIKELEHERRALDAPEFKPHLELYANSALLQLGVNETNKIRVEKIK
jgi:hypothetical protein